MAGLEIDTNADDKIMTAKVGESSRLENESLENIKQIGQTMNLNDKSRKDVSSAQEMKNSSIYETTRLGHNINVQNDITSTGSVYKSLSNELTDRDVNKKAQSFLENETAEAVVDKLCTVDDILTIFPFICGICNEKFQRLSVYLKHLSVHEKIDIFLHCCDQTKRHIEESGTLFSCGLCSMKFPTLCTLHEHLIESEYVKDFVFKSVEKTVYAFDNTDSEPDMFVKSLSHTDNGTRKRKLSHSNDNLYVGNAQSNANVKLSEEKHDRSESLHYDSEEGTDTTIIIEYENDSLLSKQYDKYKKVNERKYVKNKKKRRKKDLACNKVSVKERSVGKRKHLVAKNVLLTSVEYIVDDTAEIKKASADGDSYDIEDDDNNEKISYKEDEVRQEVKKCLKKKEVVSNRSDQMFPCEVCGAVFKHQYLERHRRTHKERTLSCDHCENLYNCKSKLKTHVKQVHTEEKKFTCDECGKSFKAWPYLKQHRQVHIKERNILCPACPMRFKYAALLRVHLKTHSDQKPYICEQCGMKFKRADLLTTHKKYHTDDKPFSCPECSKTFKVKQDMKKHFRIHLPPKFFCSICGKSFVQKYNMRVHMKIHGSVS